ncbi:LuxR C-terminal-related transcriptional regulator [Microbacterium sulfonylureivorans]|uniref:LuxR C-terminal-related transcriptional regulator n=1 Tax=Microbacterium sulfonylureivorans TaxID=2486854 RepID=UPI0013DE8113|nr:LuxR C-terminal-related transcriptional regulator [Microbacterium sulfonylureivorans]
MSLAATSSFPWTRFRPPETQRGALARPRLTALLDDAVASERITVVSAPSGYGKTSAVSMWAASRPEPVAWLSLSVYDADPAQLGLSVIEALQSSARRGPSSVAPLLGVDPQAEVTGDTYRALCEALAEIEGTTVLVVDDAHRTGDALSESLLGALIDSAPDSLRIVLVGTPALEISLSRHILSTYAKTVSADDLAFDATEIAALAAGTRFEHDDGALLRETRGWPIAVRAVLVGGAYPSALEPGSRPRLLHEYVRDFVLRSLPPQLTDFVLATTVRPDVTASLAAALSGRPDAGGLLEQAVKLGLFLDRFRSGRRTAYRWHPVFAQECRAILAATDPERLTLLQKTAARFLSDVDPLASAAHWLEAGEAECALEVLLDGWVTAVVGTEAAALDRLCIELPAPLRTDPRVMLIRACAQDVLGGSTHAKLLFAQAEAAAAERPALPRYDSTLALTRLFLLDQRADVAAASADVRARLSAAAPGHRRTRAAVLYLLGWAELRHRGDPAAIVELLQSALREADAIGDVHLARRAASQLAFAQAWGGHLKRARTTLSMLGNGSAEDPGPWGYYAGEGAGSAAGFVAYWANDLEDADREFSRVIDGGGAARAFAGIARMMLAFTAAAMNDPLVQRRAARELAAMPKIETHGLSWPAFRLAASAVLEEAAGNRARAMALARSQAEATDVPLVAVTLSGILRRGGEVTSALRLIENQRAYADIAYVHVAQLTTSAVLQERRDDLTGAHGLLDEALRLASREGIRKPFCEDDPVIRRMLGEHLRWGTAHEELIASFLAPQEPPTIRGKLTSMERAVLERLRTDATVIEIADTLGISVNTVKTHQRAIYRKLGASTRREAVRLLH